MTEVSKDELARHIENLRGGKATWVEAVPVTESFQGQIVWEGEVQVYDLEGQPEASRVYAWSYQLEDGKRKFVAVLHKPPVDSPAAAVRAAIVAEGRE